MHNAEEILEQALSLFNNEVITQMPIIGTCCLSNHGGVTIFYLDSDCVVAQYYNNEPAIYEVEYIDDEDDFNEDNRPEQIAGFYIGETFIRLDHCIRA